MWYMCIYVHGCMYPYREQRTTCNRRKVITHIPSFLNVPGILCGVHLLRILQLIELDELIRDRSLDKDLIDIAHQLRGKIDLHQSASERYARRGEEIYLHCRGRGFRDDIVLAPLVAHSISAGLYPRRGFDVSHPITCSDASLVG